MKNFQENRKWIVTVVALFFAFAFSMSAKQGTLASLQFDSNSSHPYLDTMDMDSYMDSYEGSSEEYEYDDPAYTDEYYYDAASSEGYEYDDPTYTDEYYYDAASSEGYEYQDYEEYDDYDDYDDYDMYQPSEDTTTHPVVDPSGNYDDYGNDAVETDPAGYIQDYKYDIEVEPIQEAAPPASDPIDDVFDDDEPVPAIEDEDNSYYLEKILQKLLRMFGA